MKLRFLILMLPMLNFGSDSVERSRSAVAMGIQSSDFVVKLLLKLSLMTCLGRTKGKFKGLGNIFLDTVFIIELIFLKKSVLLP